MSSDHMQAATAAWYAVKNDTRSPSPTADPTPYIAAIVRAILAAKDAEIADGEVIWVTVNGEETRAVLTDLPAGTPVRISALRGEGDA